jgi:hypothetical protein
MAAGLRQSLKRFIFQRGSIWQLRSGSSSERAVVGDRSPPSIAAQKTWNFTFSSIPLRIGRIIKES